MTEYPLDHPRITRCQFEYLNWLLTVKLTEITGHQLTQQEIGLIGLELAKTNNLFKHNRWQGAYFKYLASI
tara:strand:+ start:7150 stop:7362 length:213 start_codon:yes stop_codon:yes gene_type:complete